MKPKLILCLALVLSGGFVAFVFIRLLPLPAFPFDDVKTDQRVESVSLPSGEMLENHTYYESGFRGGERYNKLFLKNPANGNSELVGNLDYEQNISLFSRFPHPQEFVRGNEKVLVIGSIVCKRWDWKKGPYWYIASFDSDEGFMGASKYLQSFLKPNELRGSSVNEGPDGSVHFICDNLDLENNVLTVKKADGDYGNEYPDYLVYSAVGYNGGSGYEFTWKFDEARTRAKNGQRWINPMPFRITLDFSVITFPIKPGFFPYNDNRDRELARAGATEIGKAAMELSDVELRRAECTYAYRNNTNFVDKIDAIYGHACLETNRFYIVWEPRNPETLRPVAELDLNEWKEVDESVFEGNIFREEYIRLRKIEP